MKKQLSNFIMAVLKSPVIHFLDETYVSPSEFVLAKKMQAFASLNVRIATTKDENVVLLWESRLNQTIACHISDDGLNFTGIGCYYVQEKTLFVPVSARFYAGTESGNIIAEEVEQIKSILLSYDESLEKAFY